MNREVLIKKGFKEKYVNSTYYYQLGYVCLRFEGLGEGRFLYEYLMGSLVGYKVIKSETELNTLLELLN